MFLIIICVMLTSLALSVHFSGVYLAQVQKSYYIIFVLISLLVLVFGIMKIYYLTQNDENKVRFLFWNLVFMLGQIVLTLLMAFILSFLKENKKKKTGG
jgi:biotin transporter BioY